MANNFHDDETLLMGALRMGGRFALDGVWKFGKWVLGQFGIVVSWKFVLVAIIILLVLGTIFAGYASIVTFSQGVADADEIWNNDSYEQIDKDLNNAEYVRKLIMDGDVDTTKGAMGMVEFQDLYDILTAVTERENAKDEEITIEYESEIWERVLDGEGEYSNEIGQWDNTGDKETSNRTLHRNDLEAEGGNTVYSNSYMLRWQPVLVLCIMRAQHEAGNWGYDEWVGEGELDYNDYFLTDEMIADCIAVFDYEFMYYFDFFGQTTTESIKDSYKFDDLYSYYVLDGRLSDTQGRTALHHVPVSAPAYVRNSYITITYNLEEAKIETRTLRYTPHKFMAELEAAAGGSFNKDEFLMMLSALPGTEDLVEEYSKIFAMVDMYETDADVPMADEDLLYTIYVNTYYFGGEFGDLSGEYFYIQVPSHTTVDGNGNEKFHQADIRVGFPVEAATRVILCQTGSPDAPGVGDYMTIEEIEYAISRWADYSYYEINTEAHAKALYKIQNETGLYIPAVLAIIRQEGAANKGNIGAQHGNYFNFKPSASQRENGWYYIAQTKLGPMEFFDVKAMGEALYTEEELSEYGGIDGWCLYYVLNRQIYTNYVSKGQDTLFEFCWWYGSMDTGVTPGGAVDNALLSHCFCPWWEDYAFGEQDLGGGWSAKCTEYMKEIESNVGGRRM